MGSVVGAIPARFASSRLPGKPLRLLAGKPLIEHVYRQATKAEALARVVVLTDDERILSTVESFGGLAELTPEDCRSGTDRIAWAARRWQDDAVVNIQGDEPLIESTLIDQVATFLKAHPEAHWVTAAVPASDEDLQDPDAVKVVTDRDGYALYFSRAGIPFPRGSEGAGARLHVGIYGYQREALLRFSEMAASPLEMRESLEQLRALENGMRIKVLAAGGRSLGVDTEQDLRRVEAMMTQDHGQGGGA
jgi:3-deoxy-manno-octulosonate cytidylyltransferase (CMP-KDO synthetase)